MKLLDKIKNAIFEDDEFEELEKTEEEIKKEERQFTEEVVKKIDIEKTIPKKIELPKEEKIAKPERKEETELRETPRPMRREQHRRTPVIFNEEDFVMEEKRMAPKPEPKKKEEPKKPLYGGYKDEKPKEKFKPSPVISPVYGFVGVSPILEKPRNDEVSSFNEMFAKEKEKKPEVTLDTVRQKAFGIEKDHEEDDDLGLLYDMKTDDKPAISKITLGDAEEYFDDLGLEYNVDYKDSAKEKKTTRSTKNEELSKKVDNQIKVQKELESTRELEITKEQIKPKTAKDIKKTTKITETDLAPKTKQEEEPDEKNLYDLIDMMYENKE